MTLRPVVACLLAVAACRSDERETPKPGPASTGSAAPAPAPKLPPLVLARCAPAQLAPRATAIVWDAKEPPAVRPPPPAKTGAKKKPADDVERALQGVLGEGVNAGVGLGGANGVAGVGVNGGCCPGRIVGNGTGVGDSRIGYIGHQAQAPMLQVGKPQVSGGLDGEVVRRYVRRMRDKVEHCYEKQLLAKPGLAGTVTVRFLIDDDGTVRTAAAAGVDGEVSDCVAGVVKQITFPKPDGGGVVQVTYPITFNPDGEASLAAKPQPKPRPKSQPEPIEATPPAAPPHVVDPHEWTPYAGSEGMAPDDIAEAASKELEPAIRARMSKLETCFASNPSTGSLRAVLKVAFDGGVISARVGGLGDHQLDACLAGALIGVKVSAPPIISEVACDFTRGTPAPWRVTPDAGYKLLEVTRTELRFDGKAVTADQPLVGIKDAEVAFLVVADPDAPAKLLDQALLLTSESAATLVALRDDGKPPRLVATAPDGRTTGASGDPINAAAMSLDPRDGGLRACRGPWQAGTAAPGDKAAVAAMFGQLRELCKAPCAGTLQIAVTATPKELAVAAEVAREAGYERVMLGGSGCK